MTDEETEETEAPAGQKRVSPAVVITLVVMAVFGGVLFAKAMNKPPAAQVASPSGPAKRAGSKAQPGVTITSARNDAVADYEAALKTGKPVYVLFHSLS